MTYDKGREGGGIRSREDMDDFVIAEFLLQILAERIDCDSARSRDRKDLSAAESRRGWRVK